MVKIKNLFTAVLLFTLCISSYVSGAVAAPKETKTELSISKADKVADVYTSLIGVRELTGRNDGPMVENILASVGRKKGDAWCAAFCFYCHKQAGVTAPKSGWSPSWFTKANTIYIRGVSKTFSARKADVFGIYFPNMKRIAHVGFIDVPGEKFTITVEGNTNEAGSREGDGVYRKRRPTRTLYKVARYT